MAVDAGSLRARLDELTWVQRSLLAGGVLTVGWSFAPGTSLNARVVRDGVFFLAGPLALVAASEKGFEDIGWTVDRRALRNTLALALFVLPFYVVGSSLPSVREFYPMWGTPATPAAFLSSSVRQFALVLAAETYYRGLLCVGVREIGFKSVFISPVVYAFHHAGKPPIELVLSGPTDVLFGAVDYHAESILPSVVAHGFGLTLLDWLVLHDPLIPQKVVVRWLRWLPVPL